MNDNNFYLKTSLFESFSISMTVNHEVAPQAYIPLRNPKMGVLQIGIRACGYREPNVFKH
jgi:hypothetical protein